MTTKDLQVMQNIIEVAVEKSVKVTVNGKIEKIATEVTDIKRVQEEHIKQHEEDREHMQPVIKAFEGRSWVYKQIMAYLVPLGMAGGLAAGLAAVVDLLFKVHGK